MEKITIVRRDCQLDTYPDCVRVLTFIGTCSMPCSVPRIATPVLVVEDSLHDRLDKLAVPLISYTESLSHRDQVNELTFFGAPRTLVSLLYRGVSQCRTLVTGRFGNILLQKYTILIRQLH